MRREFVSRLLNLFDPNYVVLKKNLVSRFNLSSIQSYYIPLKKNPGWFWIVFKDSQRIVPLFLFSRDPHSAPVQYLGQKNIDVETGGIVKR